MIRLFVSDIDGCLSEPFTPFDLNDLGAIRSLAAAGRLDGSEPAFTICTGRPLGYAEAMAQAVGVDLPVLFEAGAGMFDPLSGVRTWHPDFGVEEQQAVEEIQDWLETVTAGTSMAVDRGKHTQASLIGADEVEIARASEIVATYIAQNHPEFSVAFTAISIDVMSQFLTKREGLLWLSEELHVSPEEMAFIGDTGGDLGGLRLVGTSFAPANATNEVKKSVDVVTKGYTSKGVIEAYRACADRNRS